MPKRNYFFPLLVIRVSHWLLFIAVVIGLLAVAVKQTFAWEGINFDPTASYDANSQPQTEIFLANDFSEVTLTNLEARLAQDDLETEVQLTDSLVIEAPDFLASDEVSVDGCSGEHNSAKNYTVDAAAKLLVGILKKNTNHKFSQFKCDDAYSKFIPELAKQVYALSYTWTPRISRVTNQTYNAYVQCTTLVFMAYQMAGQPIMKMGRTNAADLLATKYSGEGKQFIKFQSGVATDLPQVGDVAVWSQSAVGNIYGHVGIIAEVRAYVLAENLQLKNNLANTGIIRILNANSTRLIHEYEYRVDQAGRVNIIGLADDWIRSPDYWLRKAR